VVPEKSRRVWTLQSECQYRTRGEQQSLVCAGSCKHRIARGIMSTREKKSGRDRPGRRTNPCLRSVGRGAYRGPMTHLGFKKTRVGVPIFLCHDAASTPRVLGCAEPNTSWTLPPTARGGRCRVGPWLSKTIMRGMSPTCAGRIRGYFRVSLQLPGLWGVGKERSADGNWRTPGKNRKIEARKEKEGREEEERGGGEKGRVGGEAGKL